MKEAAGEAIFELDSDMRFRPLCLAATHSRVENMTWARRSLRGQRPSRMLGRNWMLFCVVRDTSPLRSKNAV